MPSPTNEDIADLLTWQLLVSAYLKKVKNVSL